MKTKRYGKVFIPLMLFSGSLFGQVNTEKEITIPELKEHVSTLASEEYGGRKPGTEGDIKSEN